MATYKNTQMISQKQFEKLVLQELGMESIDLQKLLRVVNFNSSKKTGSDRTGSANDATQTLNIDLVYKRIMDRMQNLIKSRETTIRTVAKRMKE